MGDLNTLSIFGITYKEQVCSLQNLPPVERRVDDTRAKIKD